MTSKIFWFSHSLVNLEHKSEKKIVRCDSCEKPLLLWWWLLRRRSFLRSCISSKNFCSVTWGNFWLPVLPNELWQWHWSYRQIEFADELLHDWKNLSEVSKRKLPRFSHLDICFSFVLESSSPNWFFM